MVGGRPRRTTPVSSVPPLFASVRISAASASMRRAISKFCCPTGVIATRDLDRSTSCRPRRSSSALSCSLSVG